MTQPSITCPRCGRTSYHPGDIANLYCGACHWWTSDPVLKDIYPPHKTAEQTLEDLDDRT